MIEVQRVLLIRWCCNTVEKMLETFLSLFVVLTSKTSLSPCDLSIQSVVRLLAIKTVKWNQWDLHIGHTLAVPMHIFDKLHHVARPDSWGGGGFQFLAVATETIQFRELKKFTLWSFQKSFQIPNAEHHYHSRMFLHGPSQSVPS